MKPAIEWLNELAETVANDIVLGSKPPGALTELLISRIQQDALWNPECIHQETVIAGVPQCRKCGKVRWLEKTDNKSDMKTIKTTKTQDPKFYIANGRLVGQSGEVPEDEPLFILRGRDMNAVRLLDLYRELCQNNGADKKHLEAVQMRIKAFQKFANEHPERMKVPDTDLSKLHDAKP